MATKFKHSYGIYNVITIKRITLKTDKTEDKTLIQKKHDCNNDKTRRIE